MQILGYNGFELQKQFYELTDMEKLNLGTGYQHSAFSLGCFVGFVVAIAIAVTLGASIYGLGYGIYGNIDDGKEYARQHKILKQLKKQLTNNEQLKFFKELKKEIKRDEICYFSFDRKIYEFEKMVKEHEEKN